jgi:hypothetical protein
VYHTHWSVSSILAHWNSIARRACSRTDDLQAFAFHPVGGGNHVFAQVTGLKARQRHGHVMVDLRSTFQITDGSAHRAGSKVRENGSRWNEIGGVSRRVSKPARTSPRERHAMNENNKVFRFAGQTTLTIH